MVSFTRRQKSGRALFLPNGNPLADRTSENPQDRVLEVQFNLRSDLSFSAKDAYYLVARDKKTGTIAWREEYRIEVSFAPIDFGF